MDYIKEAIATEPKDYTQSGRRAQKNIRLLHAAMGVSTEAAEILDAVKKHVFYGKKLDTTNLLEETGDVFWYLAILADILGIDFEQAMKSNLKKLKARYNDGYTDNSSLPTNYKLKRVKIRFSA